MSPSTKSRPGPSLDRSVDQDGVDRIVVPADIDAPDKIAWGLSFRQLAILATGCGSVWVAYTRFGPLLAPAAWIVAGGLVVALSVTIALGRRDGLPLDVWVRHGLALQTSPPVAVPGHPNPGPPVVATVGRPVTPGPLRPQVTRIAADGTVSVEGTPRTLLACGTTSVTLRTGNEQAAILAGFGRWLNALTGPTQILVAAARHDLTPHAEAVLDAAARLPHPALRDAAADHAEFLLHLDTTREPLRRQPLVVVPAGPQTQVATRALTALGIWATPLDGPAATAALAGAVDPYDPPVAGPRAAPGVPVTGHLPTPPPAASRISTSGSIAGRNPVGRSAAGRWSAARAVSR